MQMLEQIISDAKAMEAEAIKAYEEKLLQAQASAQPKSAAPLLAKWSCLTSPTRPHRPRWWRRVLGWTRNWDRGVI